MIGIANHLLAFGISKMYFLPDDNKFELTADEKALLQQTVITENSPSTILRDFQVLLDYVREYELEVTKNHQLPIKVSQFINDNLAHPIQHNLSRPTQKSLPNVSGLYLILRASGLASIDTSGKKARLKLNEQVYSSWQGLNLTERYFTLLESWLLRGSEEMLGEWMSRFYSYNHPLVQSAYFQNRLKQPGWLDKADNLVDEMRYLPGLYNLALMEMFGLIVMQSSKPVEKGGWWITAVELTQYGSILLSYLAQKVLHESDILLEFETPAQVIPGQIQPFLQPYFPQWQNNIQWPNAAFRNGTYIFRVSLDKNIWRRIAIDAEESLETLSLIILEAFNFDDDHLHRFIYKSHLGTREVINHAYLDEGPFTSEVRVGDVPLPTGGIMDFNFDFGDNWYFEVQLESVEDDLIVLTEPKILESHGEAPEQYPSWDDEW